MTTSEPPSPLPQGLREPSAAAVEIIARYYPLERIPQKTLYALEELLPKAL